MDVQDVIKLIGLGHNVFVTGGAGTGKSYMLDQLRKKFWALEVTASTGIAAVNVSGTTIHSWAGLGLGDEPANEIMSKMPRMAYERIKDCSMLAIDEVSMLNGDVLNLLNIVFKTVRCSDRPFGGIQLLLFGDFFQLPPVTKFGAQSNFAFESDAWKEAEFKNVILTKVYRQSDKEFSDILNNIRIGEYKPEDIEKLKARSTGYGTQSRTAMNIYSTNKDADGFNSRELDKLTTPEHTFNAIDEGEPQYLNLLRRNCLAPENLIIKDGARVMLLRNLEQELGLVNGARGTVVDIMDGRIEVKFDNGYYRLISREDFDVKVNGAVVATRKQFPLRLAWAITIHKSQGMTLESVRCDFSKIFEYGQCYVALSRCKSLEGLFINNFNEKKVIVNPKVVKFYKEISCISSDTETSLQAGSVC